ncbi:hypothetical protein DDB_G0280851 [Dictyostelium discoideum AX4]|uniref:FAD dependent oxidoreductase domain-containing protein n=1 Tax=Dictyostelium discoideum TaxID=44689 RepID=Q54US8_DICDI|nr:hypothetical protein DDB_G0280851 [Dictyostelium discoideum AX4]EAL66967.1 hypothetical protein DDB_G0280851 [Dictyostelium discoideum AX4]|eukprot:XP_640943.1 hypothetical protein DDB_G0280851 [Dictyostelium discoideum AX4]
MNNQQATYTRRIQNIQSHIVNSNNNSNNSNNNNNINFNNKNNNNNEVLYDCIVIGGGITGSSACYQMAKDGLKVLMLEQFKEAHDKGSSHGDGRIIRFSYPEDTYIRLAKLVYPEWSEIERLSNTKLIHITGGLDFGHQNAEPLKDLIESYKRNNIDYQILSKKEAESKFPQFKFRDNDLIVFQKDSGVAYASKSIKTIWSLCKRFGGQILDNKKVSRIKVESESLITVLCEDQSVYKTKKIVLACGGWINDLIHNSQLNITLPLEISQETVFYWEPKLNNTIDYTQFNNPVSIFYDNNSDVYYSLPQIDVKGVKIGYHHSGNVLENMESKKLPFKKENYDKVKGYVGEYMPGLNNDKEGHSVVCHYTNTSDWHFIIDKHPRFTNVVIASPCSGHGFKFGPAIGKLISNLVQNKPNPIDTNDEFLLKRFNSKTFPKRISA